MTTTAPFKTQLGHEEIRARALKLGQRHRTLLFLIDGRRPLAEVLSLAQRAGSATHHFEDLLRLGLVDIPPDTASATTGAQADDADRGSLTSVELVVPFDADAVVTTPAPLVCEVRDHPDHTPIVADLQTVAEVVSPAVPLDAEPRADEAPAAAAPSLAAPVEMPQPTIAPPAASPGVSSPGVPPARMLETLHDVVTPVARDVREVPVLDIDLPLPDEGQAQMLRQVRDLLTDTLRIDAPLFSARTFVRVRNAQSASELMELVWEIQDHLSRKRHTRRELQSLQRARELLGLGNTLVSEDSRLDFSDQDGR